MIEAVKFWNEPNNNSHYAFEIDPDWKIYASMVKSAAQAARAENPGILRVLGGISPIDPNFIRNLQRYGALDDLDAVGVHGFPLDWNYWHIDQWPAKIAEFEAVTHLPVWVTEVGISTFGAEEVQEFGLRRTFELLSGRVNRIHWYSLYDLPKAWDAIARNREAEGSSYYRHFYMGLLHEDGTPKKAVQYFKEFTPEIGICQWFRFEDHRLDTAVAWLRKLGVKRLRTGLSWAHWLQPRAECWFDKMMKALEEFDLTITFCFTPESKGIQPHQASPPQHVEEYTDFCVEMMRRYA
ncbi:beta-xylosidase [Segetibacter sp. 3557_3]|uniref:beta-xylosidase n=1 Tax=Segetibacter sp. 3557_3 TaxID=2547429 RepID=UPI001058F741|nr:beta-xylosidase [Segetibacter sp. 3557_3]TDH18416.1 beta-xylosidase [Segetibacter sp. 3557_3]